MPPPNTLIAVVGPTATGKSELAAQIALRYYGEVVSADSRQIYRGMDIGAAKPSAEHLAAVPHHLIGMADPREPYSLAIYLRQARRSVADILERGRLPVVAGGSGQYVWGLLEGWQVPNTPPSPEVRAELEARAAQIGARALHAELAETDPEAARRIHPHNVRRVIRAIELRRTATGPPASMRKEPPPFSPLIIGLDLDRAELYRRIDARADAMMAAGWLDEVRALVESGCSPDLPSMSSHGYGELARHLQGEIDLADALRATKTRIHKFARQQRAWFRADDPRIAWFDASSSPSAPLSHLANILDAR